MHEWAAENLLFVLELVQIKYEFQIQHFDFDPAANTGSAALSPQSTIRSLSPININKQSPGLLPRDDTFTIEETALDLGLDILMDDDEDDRDPEISQITFDRNNSARSSMTDGGRERIARFKPQTSSAENSPFGASTNVTPFPDPFLRKPAIPEFGSIEFDDEKSMKDVRDLKEGKDTRDTVKLEREGSRSRSGMKLHKRASSVKLGCSLSTVLRNHDGSIFTEISLPSGLPKSEIVNTKNNFTDRLYELYLKYIKTGSEHEINISYSNRGNIADVLKAFRDRDRGGNNGEDIKKREVMVDVKSQSEVVPDISQNNSNFENEYDIFPIMDAACIEILYLMVHSYKRFILTPEAQGLQIFTV